MKRQMKDKNAALHDFCNAIQKSWTWENLTPEELERFAKQFSLYSKYVQGNYEQRYAAFHLAYATFLAGCGYDGFNWREGEKEEGSF